MQGSAEGLDYDGGMFLIFQIEFTNALLILRNTHIESLFIMQAYFKPLFKTCFGSFIH